VPTGFGLATIVDNRLSSPLVYSAFNVLPTDQAAAELATDPVKLKEQTQIARLQADAN
jgi:hypothetical protein